MMSRTSGHAHSYFRARAAELLAQSKLEPGCLHGGRPSGHHHIDFETHQLGREFRKPLGTTIRRPIFNDQILPFDVTKFPELLAQGSGVAVRVPRSARGEGLSYH
jgi:hypothetical protein